MKILLVKPYWPYPITKEESTYNRIWPPLCLANCAALLRVRGYEVKILDTHAERISSEKIAKISKNYDIIFVTSSSLDRWQCPNLNIEPFLKTVQKIRKVNKNLFVMGYHGTVAPEIILRKTGARGVVRGEPEMTVLEICEMRDFAKIKGITYRKNKKIVSTPIREFLDLKKLPIPAFDLLPLNKYFYEILGNKFLLFEFSRGCPFKCSFCAKEVMYKSGVRKKSFKQITEELEYAIEDLGVKKAYFFDLEFSALGSGMIERICDFLIEKNYPLKWCCQSRVGRFAPKLLAKMKKAGCELIHCGLETGSLKTLARINKALSLKEMTNGLREIKKSGIKTLCFFMLGFPWELKADIEATIRFAKKIRPNYVGFHIFNPYRQFGKESCSRYFSPLQLRKYIKKAFLQFYLNPKQIFSLISSSQFKLAWKQLYLFLRYYFR